MLWALLLFARQAPAQTVPAQAALLENRSYSNELITRIRGAKRRIICAFYLFKVTESRRNIPAAIAGELVRARQRGVEVTVILEAGREVGEENLAAAGILVKGGINVVYLRKRRGVTHVKAAAIDDRYVLIGSHNLSQSALTSNNELSVVLDSPPLAMQVRRYLEEIRYK
jgi:phosphatidylserine/phosphatidylglycerophosphate/cardiolipin synthase-like enzyme